MKKTQMDKKQTCTFCCDQIHPLEDCGFHHAHLHYCPSLKHRDITIFRVIIGMIIYLALVAFCCGILNNLKKDILVGSVGSNGIMYKSIQISEEAKEKVIQLSKTLKMSQRDTASKVILDWGLNEPPFKGYTFKTEQKEIICWSDKEGFEQYLENKEKIAQGFTVYEVIEGDRCIKK